MTTADHDARAKASPVMPTREEIYKAIDENCYVAYRTEGDGGREESIVAGKYQAADAILALLVPASAQASPAALEGVDDLERKAQWLWRLTGTGTKRWMDVPEVARIRFREKAAEYETAFGLTAFPALMGPTEENKNG